MDGFHGRLVEQRWVADLRITEIEYAPGQHIPDHDHDSGYLSFVLRGGYVERAGGSDRLCAPSTLLYHPVGERHTDAFFDDGGRCFNIELCGRWVSMPLPAAPSEGVSVFERQLASRAYAEFRRADRSSALIIEGVVLEMIGALSRLQSPRHRQPPRWLLDARTHLLDHSCSTISLAELARQSGVHPVHFTRMFRRHFHCSPGDFLRHARVDHAAQLLASTDQPLVDIAADAGFSSQSHFSTVFKRFLSVTPAEYRRAHRR